MKRRPPGRHEAGKGPLPVSGRSGHGRCSQNASCRTPGLYRRGRPLRPERHCRQSGQLLLLLSDMAGKNRLVDKDINLPRFADFQSCLYQSLNLVQVTDAGPAQFCFATSLSNSIRHLLRALFTPAGNIVHDHVGTPLCEEDSNTGSNASTNC